jgi:transposase
MEGAANKRRNVSLAQRMQTLRERHWHAEQDLSATRAALAQSRQLLARQQRQLAQAQHTIDRLNAKVKELTEALQGQSSTASAPLPAFVKPNVTKQDRKTPGRPVGHAPAHRPLPACVDVHVDVTVPRDTTGAACCPVCRSPLSDVHTHERIVEDLVPSKVVVTCYHTISGYCASCRKCVESRDGQQPPAPPGVDLPQGQLGLNALATAALLRMVYRLPYRQISGLFGDLSQLTVSSGAVADQIQRLGRWLETQYDRLKVLVRLSPVVHMDETSWRMDGQNQWLWTMLSGQQTVFHIDKSRGHKVAKDLLGEQFSGTLVSDFYSAYGPLDCPKQKCLVHLLREFRETAQKYPAFAALPFARRGKRLVQEMLLLKRQKPTLQKAAYQQKARKLERRVLELSRDPPGGVIDSQAKRLAKRLRRHGPELTTFLWSDAVDGTNNAAERALRPAVIARKISGGSRSAKGAQATAVLLSIFRTAQQQHCPLLETIKTLLTAHWSGQNPAVLTDLLNAK